MAKSEIFVINFKSNNSSKYAALDSRDSLIKSDNPTSFKHYFSHEQATALVKALRAKGLEEGVEVRAKSLMQAVRDYSWTVLQAAKDVELVDEETHNKVLARYPAKAKAKDKPAEAETPVADVVEPEVVEVEAAE